MNAPPVPTAPASTLLDGLAGSPHLMALFDAEDRLRWCNQAFSTMFGLAVGHTPTWRDLMRQSHHNQRGSIVAADDFEAWLTSAASRRGKLPYRAFEGDFHDGRWYWMSEQKLADGSLLCLAVDVTVLRADERSLRLARDIAERQAVSDPLTGLGNRRHVMEALAHALESPGAGSAWLAMVDLDHFKQINDRCGHQGGDQVLRDFARLLLATLRRDDVIGRIGGEEFLLLLPAISLADAQAVMQRLLQATRQSAPLPQQPQCRYTCSIGLVTLDGCSSIDALLGRADRALYAAKTAGRDRCVVLVEGASGSG